MYMDGMDIETIAKQRGMVEGTIYGHLINFIGSDIDPEDLIAPERLTKLMEVMRKNKGKSSSEIKMILGEAYSYPDITLGRKVLEMEG
jgi:uncharacterized protein YpbB